MATTPTPPPEEADEASVLKSLTANIQDQDDLERDVTNHASEVLREVEDKNDKARIDKTKQAIRRLEDQRTSVHAKIGAATSVTQAHKYREQLSKIEHKIALADAEISEFEIRIDRRQADTQLAAGGDGSAKPKPGHLVGKSHHEYLIRTGKITPFASVGSRGPAAAGDDLADATSEAKEQAAAAAAEPASHQILRMPGFSDAPAATAARQNDGGNGKPKAVARSDRPGPSSRPRKKQKVRATPGDDDGEYSAGSVASAGDESEPDLDHDMAKRRKVPKKLVSAKAAKAGEKAGKKAGKKTEEKAGKDGGDGGDLIDLSRIDDGNEDNYQKRLVDWVERRCRAREARKEEAREADEDDEDDEDEKVYDNEWNYPSPDTPSLRVNDELRIPGDIHPALFGYQKTGIQWLAELYKQQTGGIIADEMGLGKTVQVISFIASLHHSNMLNKPVLVVAPATLLQQWVSEFHRWWPALRVSILHASGSGMVNLKNEADDDEEVIPHRVVRKSIGAANRIIDRVTSEGHVLVTTYAGMTIYADELVRVPWGYAVLDEGHKIRNPNADVTVTCKELLTPHRIILSGTPVQNNLSELWSLFDFVYPMRLGTLTEFRINFEIPIRQGGFANAGALQIMTAEKCAEALKDTISNYLLQRLKVDVAADLPEKTEQVLFCKLTPQQRSQYVDFLKSIDIGSIAAGKRRSLASIEMLRKICNHPDVLVPNRKSTRLNIGDPDKSGKLKVVHSLIKIWKRFGHKTLLFSQGKQMLDILEAFLRRHMPDVNYFRMDGDTQIGNRQVMIDQFNTDPNIHVFLMTTRTGGLGTNLTGADRIIIYDPDWNPSTDMQARERAWRLGQTKPVGIYRLMTSGTIEEKIYRRQIFKQFLTSKVLHDPKQRATLDLSDLYDLFAPPPSEEGSQRGEIFQNAEIKFDKKNEREPRRGHGHHGDEDAAPRHPTGRAPESASIQNLNHVNSAEKFVEDKRVHDEKRMVAGIFSRSVDSAYQHDQIVAPGGRPKIRADPRMLESEARRVAEIAAGHLRRAEKEARDVPIGIVTWTGLVGTGGQPPDARRGKNGPRSTALLRSGSFRSNREVHGDPTTRPPSKLKARDFETMVIDFLERRKGRATKRALLDFFTRWCPTQLVRAEFEVGLRRVAAPGPPMEGDETVWTLQE